MTGMARERVPPARSTIATAVTLLAALLLVPLALAPRAEAFIYWTSGDPEAIGRANLDGTGINRHLIPDTTANAYPRDLALDAEHISWAAACFSESVRRTQIRSVARYVSRYDARIVERARLPA